MRFQSKYILITSSIIIGLLVYRYFSNPYLVSGKDFKEIYSANDIALKELYEKQCQIELKVQLIFPLGKVSKAVVSKGYFGFDKMLSLSNTNKLLRIINDSASYEWGEVGTFIWDNEIIFYDLYGNRIGLVMIEEEGGKQIESYPYLKRTKWGSLTDNAFNEFNSLIQ